MTGAHPTDVEAAALRVLDAADHPVPVGDTTTAGTVHEGTAGELIAQGWALHASGGRVLGGVTITNAGRQALADRAGRTAPRRARPPAPSRAAPSTHVTELSFVDTETSGTDPGRHEVWDVAVIQASHDLDGRVLAVTDVWSSFVDADLATADAMALRVGRYYDRRAPDDHDPAASLVLDRVTAAREVAWRIGHRHLVAAVPSFDDAFLDRLLRAARLAPGWHYHLVDVEALAAGWLAGLAASGGDEDASSDELLALAAPPWRSDELLAPLAAPPDAGERHTAVGDARWALRVYAAVHGLTVRWPDGHDHEHSGDAQVAGSVELLGGMTS